MATVLLAADFVGRKRRAQGLAVATRIEALTSRTPLSTHRFLMPASDATEDYSSLATFGELSATLQ
jgi:hypothetical protein